VWQHFFCGLFGGDAKKQYLCAHVLISLKILKKQIMKKVILSAILALSAATMANAQLFVGGSVGFDGNGTTTPIGTDKDEAYQGDFAWRLSPVVGYTLSDKFLVGVIFGFGTDAGNTSASQTIGGTTTENSSSNFAWGITPIARYTAFTLGKFGLAAEARIGIGGTSSKSTIAGTSTDGPSEFTFGIGAVPVVTYGLTDNLVLFSYLNFLNVGFAHTSITTPGVDRKASENTYGLGVDANDLAGLIGTISIGAIWQF
jgi:hypothetical protein